MHLPRKASPPAAHYSTALLFSNESPNVINLSPPSGAKVWAQDQRQAQWRSKSGQCRQTHSLDESIIWIYMLPIACWSYWTTGKLL